MEYYYTLHNDVFITFASKLINLKIIMLREIKAGT